MLTLALVAASLVAHGDFDLDGRRDTARMIRSRNGFAVVVEHRGGARQTIYTGGYALKDPFLAINNERGWVRTACGKGYDAACTRNSTNRIRLRGGELLFGERESSSFVVLHRRGHFAVLQLSD
jgi:hypothetical protein